MIPLGAIPNTELIFFLLRVHNSGLTYPNAQLLHWLTETEKEKKKKKSVFAKYPRIKLIVEKIRFSGYLEFITNNGAFK